MKQQIQLIRSEIFRLAKQAPDLETMHWYMWLDECFENDQLRSENAYTLRLRMERIIDMEGGKTDALLAMLVKLASSCREIPDSFVHAVHELRPTVQGHRRLYEGRFD